MKKTSIHLKASGITLTFEEWPKMEERLKSKEVLCILDTGQIQKYVFKSNSLPETIGTGDSLVPPPAGCDSVCSGACGTGFSRKRVCSQSGTGWRDSLFCFPRMQFPLITCNAGNAKCIVRTGGSAGN